MNAVPPLSPLAELTSANRSHGPHDLGLVMGGGGARAAYQVGFLRCVATRFPELEIPYITGVSAGAINAALLAGHHGSFLQAVDELTELWANLRVEDVFRVDGSALAKSMMRWARRLVAGGFGGGASRTRGLVDTEPLRQYLSEVLHAVDGELTGIQSNLANGRLRAAAISTASYTTGQSITWIQGQDDIRGWERPQRRAKRTTLTVDHVMASAALPLFFPSVELAGHWYGDGGMRLTAPLAPAMHLGARRIMAISTRYDRTPEEAAVPAIQGYPPPAQVMGVLLNSIFLDLLDADAARMELLNRLILELPEEKRAGLEPVELLILRPSRDLGQLAQDFELELPRTFRYMVRGLGTQETRSPDFLSLVLFQPDYLQALMEIGQADAEARSDEIAEFLRD